MPTIVLPTIVVAPNPSQAGGGDDFWGDYHSAKLISPQFVKSKQE